MKRAWKKRNKKTIRVAYKLKLSEATKLREERIIEYILKIVEKYYKVDSNYVTTKNRRRELVFARQVAMYLIFKYSTCSLERIGDVFNGKDHATVVHAKRTIGNLMYSDKEIKSQIEELEKVVELNIKAISENIDLKRDFYYINFNDYHSLMLEDGKGVILGGFSPEEITKIKEFFTDIIDSKEHKNTGLYILEKPNESTN